VDNNGAWDYAADTRGYTVAAWPSTTTRQWSVRYGIFAMPVVANGIDMDWAFSRAHGQNGEFELRHSFVPKRKGTERVLFFANRATWEPTARRRRFSVTDLTNRFWRPNILLHEHYSALKYGLGYNTEQELTENLRVFGRFGLERGPARILRLHRSGPDSRGRWRLRRRRAGIAAADKIGLAVVSNAIKARSSGISAPGRTGVFAGRRQSQLRPRNHRSRATITGTPGGDCFMPSMCSNIK